MKSEKLSITLPPYYEEEFEDLTAYHLENGLAVGHSLSFNKWIVFDIKSGLGVSISGKTRSEAITSFNIRSQSKGFWDKLDKARNTLSYKNYCLAMEKHSMYR